MRPPTQTLLPVRLVALPVWTRTTNPLGSGEGWPSWTSVAPPGAARISTTVPWTVCVSPVWLRASVHQMAFGQVGRGVAVGSGGVVGVDLLAMIACTWATAVRRTLVAWAAGESGVSGGGAAHARLAMTTATTTLSPPTT